MQSTWVGIDSTSEGTRVLATTGPTATILKARLPASVGHPRAVPALLEALALWQGTPVRAAIVVDVPGGMSASRLCLDTWADQSGAPLYGVEYVLRGKRRHRDPLPGLSRFADLRQLVLFEVAR